MNILLKRAYQPESPADGFRIYIDRLWPRGLSHATFHYDRWDKEIAPSTELREWYHADPQTRWEDFSRRYKAELAGSQAFSDLRKLIAGKPTVTLLYSSHDEVHNNAVVLREALLAPQTDISIESADKP
ncbi:MAG: DUF488 family protein [Duncaniella sp.]|nr:DUF488 family protein [Duncaniella sp.]